MFYYCKKHIFHIKHTKNEKQYYFNFDNISCIHHIRNTFKLKRIKECFKMNNFHQKRGCQELKMIG